MTRRKSTGPKPKKPAGERFYFFKHTLPYLAFIFGLMAALGAALILPWAVQEVKHDELLRANGVTTSGQIDYVKKEHHTGRRSSWDEYTPIVSYQADERKRVKTFDVYSSKSPLTYQVDQKVKVAYLLTQPYDSILQTSSARKEIDRNLRQAVGLAIAGGVLLLYGAPIQTVKIVAWAKRRKDSRKSSALGKRR